MLLYDVKNRCWSDEMLEICGITRDMLPTVYESYEAIGKVKADLGFSEVFKYLGVKDITYNQHATLPYPNELPFNF